MSSSRWQAIIITGVAALSVAFYFAPRKGQVHELPAEETHKAFNPEELLQFQSSSLDATAKKKSEAWAAEISKHPAAKPYLYDSLALLWDEKKIYALAAYYYEKKAAIDSSEKNFLNAAYRYFDAFKNALDTSLKEALTAKAIENYTKVLALNPQNLNAKTDLGVIYAESTQEPMKGITLLREVIAADPEHENAQFNLALLSVKSNQFDKALERFDKVLQINPARSEIYIFKAQIYLQKQEKEKAIENFEKYVEVSDNPEMKKQAVSYITELKNN